MNKRVRFWISLCVTISLATVAVYFGFYARLEYYIDASSDNTQEIEILDSLSGVYYDSLRKIYHLNDLKAFSSSPTPHASTMEMGGYIEANDDSIAEIQKRKKDDSIAEIQKRKDDSISELRASLNKTLDSVILLRSLLEVQQYENMKEVRKDSPLTKVSSYFGILSFFFTIYFGVTSKKDDKKEKKRGVNLADIDFVVPTKDVEKPKCTEKTEIAFGIRAEYNGYMTTIVYTNIGGSVLKNVSVCVEQNAAEMASPTVIKNENVFPIEMLYTGDSFEIEVECYYKKAYRYFAVNWEDETDRYTQRNRILLSKNYNV